jgi:peptidoglycan-associated lipoprotein
MIPVKSIARVLYVPAVLFLGACCCNKDIVKPKTVTPPPTPPAVKVVDPMADIFFDFDRSAITSASQEQLKKNAEWMSANAGKGVMLEGHCDERGTSEYNMALGERRAQSAKESLLSLGVDQARLKTISYGEEKPFDSGHDEAAWAKNRRVHFVEQ